MLKEMNKIKSLLLAIITLSLIGISFYSNTHYSDAIHEPIDCLIQTQDSPVIINNDNDFISLGLLGDGSSTYPYRIENLTIITSGSEGIIVTSTTKHFVIRNCTISTSYAGIFVYSVATKTATIENNTFINNELVGIYCYSSNNVTISDNKFIKNTNGLILQHSKYSSVFNNILINNTHGMYAIENSIYSNFTSNILTNNTLLIDENNAAAYQTYILNNNLVNGKSIGFLLNYVDEVITSTDYGQLLLANCTGVTIQECIFPDVDLPVTLSICSECNLIGNNFTDNAASVYLIYSSQNLIKENYFINGKGGKYALGIFFSSSNNSIINNHFENNKDYAIWIHESANNTVYYNNFINNNPTGQPEGTSQAFDNGLDNIWYNMDTKKGNYWDDYSGVGSYLIDGIANSEDPFPLGSVADIPFITEYGTYIRSLSIAFVCLSLIVIIVKRKKRKNN